MGWASGFRAGTELADRVLENYYKAKRIKDMRGVESDIQAEQQARAERQFGIDRQGARTGLTAAQQQAAVMPQAPSPTGLSPQQQMAMAGMPQGVQSQYNVPSLPPEVVGRGAPTAGGTSVGMTGLSPEQLAAAAQAPSSRGAVLRGEAQYQPMSELEAERMRANRLRGLGYDEEADKAYTRAMALREEQRDIEQTAFDRDIREREQQRLQLGTEADVGVKGARKTVLEQQAELAGFEVTSEKEYLDLDKQVSSYLMQGGDPTKLQDQDFYKKASVKNRTALAGHVYDLNASQLNLQTQAMTNKLSGADTVEQMAEIYSNDERLTPKTSFYAQPIEGTGNVALYAMPDGGGAGELLTEGSPAQVKQWMFERATDPANAAALAAQTRKDYSALLAEIQQSDFDNRMKAAETLFDMYADDFGAMDDSWGDLDFNEKLQQIELFVQGALPDR
jgi:hypothetical protein